MSDTPRYLASPPSSCRSATPSDNSRTELPRAQSAQRSTGAIREVELEEIEDVLEVREVFEALQELEELEIVEMKEIEVKEKTKVKKDNVEVIKPRKVIRWSDSDAAGALAVARAPAPFKD